MTLNGKNIKIINNLRAEGFSISDISRATGLNRKTISTNLEDPKPEPNGSIPHQEVLNRIRRWREERKDVEDKILAMLISKVRRTSSLAQNLELNIGETLSVLRRLENRGKVWRTAGSGRLKWFASSSWIVEKVFEEVKNHS